MYSLAINTSIEPYGVAVLQNEKILSEVNWYYSYSQKNNHFYAIDYLFKTYNLDFKKIMFISIVNGPGSFTGLRIGFSIVKTLGFLYNLPITTITTFEAISNSVELKDYSIVINAGLKEVFIYKNDNVEIDKIENLKNYNEVLIFPEFSLYQKILNKKKIYLKIDTSIVGRIGLIKFKEGEFEDYKKVLPLYLRDVESIFKKYNEEE
ncbi:MAG: tRNA (adenosine(37)-N6)-threonylcarbamoyltransferase complex dimerization subunit type 1 TsaB [Caldisericia bacterium]